MGWTSNEPNPEFGGYFNFSKGDSLVAGGMKNDGTAGVPDLWNVYLAVENAEATVAAATAHGGGVIVPAMEVGDFGSMAVITDAGGAAIGMWQPGTHKGMGVLAEPGAPAWFELHTRDYDASVQFYTDVFGWDAKTMSDTPEFRYTTLGEGESALAGIMDSTNFLPEGVPAHWAVYLAVDGHRRRREDHHRARRLRRPRSRTTPPTAGSPWSPTPPAPTSGSSPAERRSARRRPGQPASAAALIRSSVARMFSTFVFRRAQPSSGQ